MTIAGALSAVGLIRPTGRRGFCPACRLWARGATGEEHIEIAPPALAALVFLAVAAVAWWFVFQESRTMGGMEMGPGSLASFAVGWVVMMAAMMLPSALPLVVEFAHDSERRRGWQLATGVLGATYLSVWLLFGVGCYLALAVVPASWLDRPLVGGCALALAGLYGLSPIKRASEARCRELCALHGPRPFHLGRSAMVVGARYGLSCLGCSAGLMVAMAVIGMSNLGWMIVGGGIVLVYKLAPAAGTRRTVLLSAALGALGLVYGVTT